MRNVVLLVVCIITCQTRVNASIEIITDTPSAAAQCREDMDTCIALCSTDGGRYECIVGCTNAYIHCMTNVSPPADPCSQQLQQCNDACAERSVAQEGYCKNVCQQDYQTCLSSVEQSGQTCLDKYTVCVSPCLTQGDQQCVNTCLATYRDCLTTGSTDGPNQANIVYCIGQCRGQTSSVALRACLATCLNGEVHGCFTVYMDCRSKCMRSGGAFLDEQCELQCEGEFHRCGR